MNDRAVSPTPATQRSVTNFFAIHYGFFHVTYLVFLIGRRGFGALKTTADVLMHHVEHRILQRQRAAGAT